MPSQQNYLDLINSLGIVAGRSKTSWVINGSRVSSKLVPAKLVKDHFKLMSKLNLLEVANVDSAEFLIILRESWERKVKEESLAKLDFTGIPDSPLNPNDFYTVNITNRSARNSTALNLAVVSKKTQRLAPSLLYSAWINQATRAVGADGAKALDVQIPVIEIYNPRDIRPHYQDIVEGEESTRLHMNTFQPPHYMVELMTEGEGNHSIPKIYTEFFERLFGSEAGQVEYVLEKMYQSVFEEKLFVAMTIPGGTGIGKGVFMEIVKFGVGKANFILAPDSWTTSSFNTWQRNKLAVHVDEAIIKKSYTGKENPINIVKKNLNKELAMEGKGVDVGGLEEVFASWWITFNNGSESFELEADNRRFSVLTTTHKKLLSIRGSHDESRQYIASLLAEDNLSSFWKGLYYLHKGKPTKYSTEHLWKGEAYSNFVLSSRKTWEGFLYTWATTAEEIMEWDDIEDMFLTYVAENPTPLKIKKFGVSIPKVINYFEKTTHVITRDRIARVVGKGKRSAYIIPQALLVEDDEVDI